MKKKIVQIVRSPAGGIRKHILSIIEGLGDEYEISIILDPRDADQKYLEFVNSNKSKCVKIYNLYISEKPGFRDILNLFKILTIIKELSPDVLHGHGAKGGAYARVLGFFFNVRTVYTAHGGAVHDMHGRAKNLFYSFVERFLYFITDALVFESKYTMRQYCKKTSRDISDHKFHLNYNAIYFSNEYLNLKCRKIYEDEEIIVGAFGLLRKIKGHDLLIHACSDLIGFGYNIKLQIYGSGEESGNLLSLAQDLGIKSSVQILKEVTNVQMTMTQCHIVAHPSRFESFGYVPLEALLSGATVVSSLSGGLMEVMDKGASGFCVDTLSSENLVVALEMAILNEDDREAKFNHGINYLSRMFSEERFFDKLRSLY